MAKVVRNEETPPISSTIKLVVLLICVCVCFRFITLYVSKNKICGKAVWWVCLPCRELLSKKNREVESGVMLCVPVFVGAS